MHILGVQGHFVHICTNYIAKFDSYAPTTKMLYYIALHVMHVYANMYCSWCQICLWYADEHRCYCSFVNIKRKIFAPLATIDPRLHGILNQSKYISLVIIVCVLVFRIVLGEFNKIVKMGVWTETNFTL